MNSDKTLLLYTIDELGFYKKNSLVPEDHKEFLGFIFTSKGSSGHPEILVPKYKLRKLSQDLSMLLKKDVPTARTLAMIAGVCVI